MRSASASWWRSHLRCRPTWTTLWIPSGAYGNQNETYILKSNGTRMNDGRSQEQTIQSYNVLSALEEMGAGDIWYNSSISSHFFSKY